MRATWTMGAAAGLIFTATSFAQSPKPVQGTAPRALPAAPVQGLPYLGDESGPAPGQPEDKAKSLPALIRVKVPDNATVWFENQKMNQAGSLRIYQSPGLDARKIYYYKIKVSWPTGGGTLAKDFVTEQEVTVRGGETTSVDFTPLVTHTKEQRPGSTREMIRQAAHNTPAPDRSKLKKPGEDR
jgi:uncharacterized protein (TIGR03000 family)